MRLKNFTSLFGVLLLFFGLGISNVFSQKWSGANGNEWLAGKYGQQWVRVSVSTKGIHRIAISSLPAAFQSADKAKLQLWHRGNQVSILKADNTEILFYGVPNDGASDELLYRLPTSRKNPYFSTYSNISAYFLTIGTDNGLRAEVENTPVDNGVPASEFHNQVELKTYQTEYTHFTFYSTRPATFNSFFEDGKTGTGTRLPVGAQATSPVYTANPVSSAQPATPASNFNFAAKNVYGGSIPKVKILLSGRGGSAQVQIKVGKNSSALRQVTTANTFDFGPLEVNFDLDPAQDYDANGGTLGFQSVIPSAWFSVSYFTVSYNQTIDAQGLNSYEFNFPAASAGSKSRIPIANPPANALFYDISSVDNPRIIQGAAANLMVSRNGNALKLLTTNDSQNINVQAGNISTVTFQNINPASYNYLIIAADNLLGSAQAFGAYRQNDSPGVKYSPLVIKAKDLYNEFNYGEPSPVAIKRFVDYMISDGNKEKFLLLIGKSITRPDKIVKELPDEVPTVGFPGSDLLLVDGLAGTPEDVPAIPVGRISALTDAEVNGYLQKVKDYEAQKDIAWRKNVMHVSGGKDTGEINQFASYLSTIGNIVNTSPFNGTVIPKIKTQAADVIEEVNIGTELNGAGLGMISYFGHGSTYRTDLNPGYVTDPAKNYNNTTKFPVLFYNGCGVNNIFSNLFGSTPNTSTSRPLSLDWLIAPGKGAIVVFGNTWDAYASTSNEYLDRLYPLIFSKSDKARGTIGEILKEVALQTKIAKGYTYNPGQNSRVAAFYDADRANIHQVLLQGDPALKILINEAPLPVNLISFNAKAAGTKVEVTWKTASERNNSHFIVERSYNARNFEEIGRVEGKGDSNSEVSYSFTDSKPLAGTSYYRLKQVDFDSVVEGSVQKGEETLSRIVSVELDKTSAMSVAPNPSIEYFEIKLDVPTKISKWRLVDINGRLVKDNGTGSRVDLSNLSPGEYIIEVVTVNGDKYIKKVIKL
ncbi:C25 family cysteine peptidase [Dyadobacter sp. BHUBP1]|uniref:putative type IX secretion system sortase PorU2 n=1 Tax=Dyadobacter sp. BHUBP1 TaxID=3424178 RepID=UPI003D32F7AD